MTIAADSRTTIPQTGVPASAAVKPFSLKGAPALIERLFPVQKLSADVYKERMAVGGQTLTALGSYWKGRKPLVLNRACVLGCLLPATEHPAKDLEIFELLMSMDDVSLSKRYGLPKIDAIAPLLDEPERDRLMVNAGGRWKWRDEISEDEKHEFGAQMLPAVPYRDHVSASKRAEEIFSTVHTHIWDRVNAHLGTQARSYPELVEQLGIMRFGRRPRVADTFSGSGQIPFAAAQLGCDVYASDLNPIACMLTWGAFNIVGAPPDKRAQIEAEQKALVAKVKAEIDALGIETDGRGWRGKVYLYCLEVTCPTSGWKVPVLPTRVVSKGKRVIAQLVPDAAARRYDIVLKTGASDAEMKDAERGTYMDQSVVHKVGGVEHRNKISSIRGDYTEVVDGVKVNRNRLRPWEISDVVFRDDDIYNERLYAIQWIKDDGSTRPETEFRSVTEADLERERQVTAHVQQHLAEWQAKGWVPDMRIEPGDETDRLMRERGWTHWHQLFNPRQLFACFIASIHKSASTAFFLCQVLNRNSRLSHVHQDNPQAVFYNQALNTFFNYGARSASTIQSLVMEGNQNQDLSYYSQVINAPAMDIVHHSDIFVTDPPYGDAVKYEEINEFFIAWLRKNPPPEFKDWVWDSRRALAIKGEDHDFKLSMVAAYKNMAEHMPDNGMQIIMFTHQDNTIWADMANIVWASGLRVTAAWYVVTETDSALREGQYVKGTILLVLRKRLGTEETFRDEIAYELEEEVGKQVEMLTGLNEDAKGLYKGENLFEDADLQMAGYAAALRVLTRYAVIDGVSMPQEALRPRVKGQTTMVDDLIRFATERANEFLVPRGVSRETWSKLKGVERFYLKLVEMEAAGPVTKSACDNCAKAFKASEYGDLLEAVKANQVQVRTAQGFGKRYMATRDAWGSSLVRAVLYGIFLLGDGKTSSDDVLAQLAQLVPDYYRSRKQVQDVASYLYRATGKTRPEESRRAMVLRDLVAQHGTA